MQFFPSDVFGSASGGSAPVLGPALPAQNKRRPEPTADTFKDVLDTISAYNADNTPGASLTSRSTRDDNSYFKSDDFKHLKEKLLEAGVSEKQINEYFMHLAATTHNPTIGDMRAAVSGLLGSRQGPEMTKNELIQLGGVLGKLGFDKKEISDIEEKIARGEGLDILRAIQKKLEAMAEEGKEVEISKDDLNILLNACDISGDSLDVIAQFWENSELVADDKLMLNARSFGQLFGTTMATMELAEAELVKLSENLDEAIKSMLEYKKNKPNEAVADMRGSALTGRSEIMSRVLATLINEESEEDENSTSHLMGEKKSDAHTGESIPASLADGKKASKVAREEQELQTKLNEEPGVHTQGRNAAPIAASAQSAANGKNAQNTEAAPQRAAGQEGLLREAAGERLADGEQQSGGREENQRNNPFAPQNGSGELGADKAALAAKVQSSSGAVFSAFGQQENSSAQPQNAETAKAQVYQERIFEQVERGILKNAIDGSRQIVLRLDPPELGKLTLSLTVAHGEVKALIRTDSAATTQVVSEQLAQLKQSLEEQGFKVASLDVETRADSHAGTDNWSGTEQHNQEREMLEQSRFMRLARTRAREGDALAQTMHNVDQPASLSASGLHIIA